MINELARKVQEGLYQSFPTTPLPSEVPVTSDSGLTEIPGEISRRFSNKQWPDVHIDAWINTASVQVIIRCVTPVAFHYYLPALLIGVLYEPDYLDWGLIALLPWNKDRVPKGQWWFEYSNQFSDEQRAVIKLFISYARHVSTPGSEEEWLVFCLERIWAQDSSQ